MPDVFVSDHAKAHKQVKHDLKNELHGKPLSAFCYLPAKANFETQQAGEKIILILRKHPITNIPWMIIFLVMVAAPFVLQIFPIVSFLPERYQFVALLGWYLITVGYFIESFLSWFFNVNIITDERIVDIDFVNLIYREISDTKTEKIQDVTSKMGGVLRTVFNYGDVLIQTAGEQNEFEFHAVPKPDQVVAILNDQMLEEEQEKIDGRVR